MRTVFVSATLVALLTACGGGGGGGTSEPPPSAGALAITSTNYQRVAQESVGSTRYLLRTSEFVTGAQVASDRIVFDFALLQVGKMAERFRRASALAAGADLVEVEKCSGGGEISVTLRDLNGNLDADAGESATLAATNCVELGVRIDGALGIELKSLSGRLDDPVFGATFAVTLTGFKAAAPGGDVVGQGTMTIDIAMTGTNRGTIAVTANALSMTGTLGGSPFTRALSEFRIRTTRSPEGLDHVDAVTVDGTMSGTGLDGKSVTIVTSTPVTQLGSAEFPRAGRITVSGSGGSKVRLTVQPPASVLIELDADGNDVYESSTTKLWSDLV